MVSYCAAPECKNLADKRLNIHFHRFPVKHPEMLDLWIKALNRGENWYPYKNSRICSAHFKETDFKRRPGRSVPLLKLDAVPSIFNFSENSEDTSEPEIIVIQTMEDKAEDRLSTEEESGEEIYQMLEENNAEIYEMSEENKEEIYQVFEENSEIEMYQVSEENNELGVCQMPEDKHDAQTQTDSVFYYRSNILMQKSRQNIKALHQKVRRREQKIRSMKNLIHKLKKNICVMKNYNLITKNYSKGLPLKFQIKMNNNADVATQQRYMELMKNFSHTLLFCPPNVNKTVQKDNDSKK